MKVWLYYRLSRDEDEELNSLSNQRKIIYNYAVTNGYEVVGESFDDNVSGMHFNRPGIDRIYEVVEAGKIEAVVVKDLSRLGRHRTQTALFIDYLREHDGVNQKEIARGCHIEPGTLTSILNRMEENHLVERRMLNGNRRSLHVFLTEQGKLQAKRVALAFSQLEEEAFRNISEEERRTFMNLFYRIFQNSTDIMELERGTDLTWKN